MTKRLSIEKSAHVVTVMLNRPDKFNALDLDTFTELDAAARSIAEDRSVRAVVLCGAGPNFCAGIDTGFFAGASAGIDEASMSPTEGSPANLFQRAAYAWRELPVPVICALTGITYGGGLQIAMGADLRFAAADARFSIMESKWGLIPDMAISTTLRDILPPDRVKELAWTARVFDAAEALDLGIVTRVEDDPLAAARRMAAVICDRSPDAIRGIKQLVNGSWGLSEAEALALEMRIQAGILVGPNQAEAVRANLEKRAPEFTD